MNATPPAPTEVATADLRDAVGLTGTDDAALRGYLHGLPAIDPVGLEARAAQLASRSIKKDTKRALIDLAISMVDLTTLEGADTPGKVEALCRKGANPDREVPGTPSVAAICVYPDRVAIAVEALRGLGARGESGLGARGESGLGARGENGPRVKVASVATAFPAGRSSLEVKLADTRMAVEAGADEIDMVIDRGAFLAGDYSTVFEQIVATKEACGPADDGGARLKVILETGELATYDNVRRASWLALLAGADFIKTSTGKIAPAATLPVTQVMLQAVRDLRDLTGAQRAVKPAGGIRTTKDAIAYLVLVHEVAGPEWLDPHWFRFGASGVVNDLLMQRRTQTRGHYSGSRYVSVD